MKADVCIIGAGAAGLSVASGTAQLGLRTVLIENGVMGGDCLNTGCVPSKALLAAARRAQQMRRADTLGITVHDTVINYAAVQQHVRQAIAAIEPHDSQQRFEALGVTVLREHACLLDAHTVQAGGHTITARHIVLATGSQPLVPDIPGLDAARVVTNETLFDLPEKPAHLLVIGGGPIGIEMAQAHRRLGCAVTVISRSRILPRDDERNVAIIRQILTSEGITLHEHSDVTAAQHGGEETILTITKDARSLAVKGSHVLVAAGRMFNGNGLGLENAGITFDSSGIYTNSRLRTRCKHIYAIGDCVAGSPRFTHIAGYHASIVIRNICFRLPAKTDYRALPWVTFTDPEITQVGLTEAQARREYGGTIRVIEQPYASDRAIAESETTGQLRLITSKRGRILGVSIIGAHAGEMASLWQLTIGQKMRVKDIAGMMVPYPTFSDISKQAAGSWYKESLFSGKTRRLVKVLQRF